MTRNIKDVLRRIAVASGRVRNRDVVEALGITPQAVHYHLRRLTDSGFLELRGQGRGAHYVLTTESRSVRDAPSRQGVEVFEFRTRGLKEDQVWANLERDSAALSAAPAAARRILTYATTELVNNAIDHSDADKVRVGVARGERETILEVDDRGVGAFARAREAFGLATDLEALAELSKGKRTTQPDRHSGEGLFFVSKAVKHFELESGTLRWTVDDREDDVAFGELASPRQGTRVRVIVPDTPRRTMREVFDEFTIDHEFRRTRIVVRLFEHGTHFISRSEAKRLLEGLEKFAEVILDFRGVTDIGQGFADEVFRVWASNHPAVRLMPQSMVEPVEFMVKRAMRPQETRER